MGSLHEMVNSICKNKSRDPSIIYDDHDVKLFISYAQLCDNIQELAIELGECCKEAERVGILLDTGISSICAILSLIKIEVVACPLFPGKNLKRISECSEKLKLTHIIIEKNVPNDAAFFDRMLQESNASCRMLKPAKLGLVLVTFNKRTNYARINKHRIQYIVTSSGSTGDPKVIEVPGKCIVPNIRDLCKIFKVTKNDVLFMSSPLTFDASIVQIFIALVTGAALLVTPDIIRKQPMKLVDILFVKGQCTILQATPSFVHLLGKSLAEMSGLNISETTLRILAFGAEPFPAKSIVKKWISNSNIQVFNIYGISEVSSWASVERVFLDAVFYQSCTKDPCSNNPDFSALNQEGQLKEFLANNISIGAPLSGTVIEVRKDSGEILNDGIGEIWIGGEDRVCLVDGETDLVPNTMRPTGDLGLIADGKIYYVQRKDNRVKIFGKFVDLEEIERIAEETNGVKLSVCVAVKTPGEIIDKLILFMSVVDTMLSGEIERSALEQLLKVFPHLHFRTVILDGISLNAHGKKDRIKLQKTAQEEIFYQQSDKVLDLECFVIDLLETKTRLDLSAESNFYDKERSFVENGGDSFAAVYVESKVRDFINAYRDCNCSLELLYDNIVSKDFNSLMMYLHESIGGTKHEKNCVQLEVKGQYLNARQNSYKIQELKVQKHGRNYEDHSQNTGPPGESNTCNNCCNNIEKRMHEVTDTTDVKIEIDSKKTIEFFGLSSTDTNKFNENTNNLKAGHVVPFCRSKAEVNLNEDLLSPNISKRNIYGNSVLGQFSETTTNSYTVQNSFEQVKCTTTPTRNDSCLSPKRKLNEQNLSSGYVKQFNSRFPDQFECFCSISRGSKYTTCFHCKTAGRRCCYSMHRIYEQTSPLGLVTEWKHDTLKCVDASPLVVCNGDHTSSIVYVGSHSHDFCSVNVNTGRILWKTQLGDRIESSATISNCGRKIVVGCYDHSIYVISRETGCIVWKFKTGECVKSSPVINEGNGFAFVGSHDHFLYALNIDKCVEVWRVFCGAGSCFSSPALSEDNRNVFIGTLGGIFLSVNSKTGNILWTFSVNKPIFSSPIFSSGFVCFGCVAGVVYLLKEDGTLIWKFQTNSPIFSSPCFASSSTVSGHRCILIGCHDMHVYCLSIHGDLIWKFKGDSPIYSIPFTTSSINYNTKVNETDCCFEKHAVVCSTKGTVYIIDLDHGTMSNSRQLTGEIFSSPVVVGNRIIVGCRDNHLYCISA